MATSLTIIPMIKKMKKTKNLTSRLLHSRNLFCRVARCFVEMTIRMIVA